MQPTINRWEYWSRSEKTRPILFYWCYCVIKTFHEPRYRWITTIWMIKQSFSVTIQNIQGILNINMPTLRQFFCYSCFILNNFFPYHCSLVLNFSPLFLLYVWQNVEFFNRLVTNCYWSIVIQGFSLIYLAFEYAVLECFHFACGISQKSNEFFDKFEYQLAAVKPNISNPNFVLDILNATFSRSFNDTWDDVRW